MKSWGNRASVHADIAGAMMETGEKKYPPPELPDALVNWLAQLTLLYGMPIEYMVADSRLLPVESVRFFYTDRNWLDRMVDGALSVGVLSSKEAVFNEAFFEDIYAQIDTRQAELRAILKDKPIPVKMESGGVITGMLFRSQVVSSWPGVEVMAYKKDKDGNEVRLNTLRMDLLSNNLLFCLFGGVEGKVDGVPDLVEIIEPGEGLHFGVELKNPPDNTFSIPLRGLGYPLNKPYPAGEQIMVDNKYLTAEGTSGNGVIDIKGLIGSIKKNMPKGAIPNDQLSPAALAIQLVAAAGMQQYPLDLTIPQCANTQTQQ